MLFFYRIFSWLATLVVPGFLLLRAHRGKEVKARLGERFGRSDRTRPVGTLVWFHAASMGESISVLPLIERLVAAHPELHVLLTTVTVTSAATVAPRLPERAFHQFVPVDLPWVTARFIRHWQPDLAVWVESEFWPNQMLAMHRTGKKMLLLNARISERSERRWQKAPRAIKTLLSFFDAILAKSEEDADRLKALGAQRVECLGNLKFSSPALGADEGKVIELRQSIGRRPFWLAASTHPGEEEMIANIHQHLRRYMPALLTIIVPRHSARGGEIAAMLRAQKMQGAQRSKHERIDPQTEIYLGDTMGELGVFYRAAGIVFIGGSLVPHGGQNPFEPARLHCAILYGPYMHNFKEFCVELEKMGGALRARNAEDLGDQVEMLFRNIDKPRALAEQAFSAVNAKQGIVEKVFARLEMFLPSAEK